MLLKEEAKSVEVRKSPSKSTYKVFTFECIKCGEDIKAQSGQLEKHSGMCRRCSQRGLPYAHIFNELLHVTKRSGKHKVDLSYEDFLDLIKEPICHYCSKDLVFHPYSRDEDGGFNNRAYQLDRKDNNIGYIKSNLVPCCWNCNRIKSDIYSYDEFIQLSPILKEIHKNR